MQRQQCQKVEQCASGQVQSGGRYRGRGAAPASIKGEDRRGCILVTAMVHQRAHSATEQGGKCRPAKKPHEASQAISPAAEDALEKWALRMGAQCNAHLRRLAHQNESALTRAQASEVGVADARQRYAWKRATGPSRSKVSTQGIVDNFKVDQLRKEEQRNRR